MNKESISSSQAVFPGDIESRFEKQGALLLNGLRSSILVEPHEDSFGRNYKNRHF